MVNITLYSNWSKDINSTKQPGSEFIYGSYECALHDPCSIVTPVIILSLPMAANLANVNYAYIPLFSRYYWITNTEWNDGRWFISMSCDTLASYKSAIGNSLQYVLRAAFLYNPAITDLKYATNSEVRSITKTTQDTPFTYKITNGSFVLGIVNDTPSFGSIHYSVLTMFEFQQLLTFLLSTGTYLGEQILNDMSLDTAKVILNPLQYIVSCQWFPFTISRTSPGTYIKIGWWTTNIIDHEIAPQAAGDYLVQKFIHFNDIPKHPQAAETEGGNERAYLNSAPYSTYKVYLPPIGEIDINAGKLCYADVADAQYDIDLLTGLATIRFNTYRADYQRAGSTFIPNVPVAVDIPVAQVLQNWRSNAMQAAQNLTTGDLSNALTNIAQAAVGYFVLNGVDGVSFSGGQQGYISPYNYDPWIRLDYVETAGTNRERFGQPLCATAPIGTLPGFIQCQDAHIEIPGATRTEITEVESFMNGGFFYE